MMWEFLNGVGNGIWNMFNGRGGIGEFFNNPSSWWDQFKNGQTNIANKEIAEKNLAYQKERNEIEDARYEEETAYNRAFAEDERAYNRALQQQLFEREDTAIERQASQLSALGINPLSQQMNGLNAGSPVSSPVAPTASTRGGTALHNDFNMSDSGMLQALSSLAGLADTVNGISSGQYTRDSLALQNDKQYLENLAFAHDLGIDYKGYMPDRANTKNYRKSHLDFFDESNGQNIFDQVLWKKGSGSKLYDRWDSNREKLHKFDSDFYNTDSPQGRLIKDLGTLDFSRLAEHMLTEFAKTADNVGQHFQKDFGAQKKIKDFFSLFN